MKTYPGGCAIMLRIPDESFGIFKDVAVQWAGGEKGWGLASVVKESYHLTLQFVGRNLEDKTIASAIVAAFTFAPRHASIPVIFTGIFGMQRTTKGCYMVAHAEASPLEEIKKELSSHLAEMGVYPKDSFEFNPHVTLAETSPKAPKTKPPAAIAPCSVEVKHLVVKYGPYKMLVEL